MLETYQCATCNLSESIGHCLEHCFSLLHVDFKWLYGREIQYFFRCYESIFFVSRCLMKKFLFKSKVVAKPHMFIDN